MSETGHSQVNQELLARTMAGLDELATGRFAERMRRDAAARVLVTVKRALRLRAAGLLGSEVVRPAQRRAVHEVERIVTGWLPASMTAAEFVGDLPPADVKVLTELAPVWADALKAAARR